MAPQVPQLPDLRQVMDAVLAALEQPENLFEQTVQFVTGVAPPPGPVKTIRALLQRAPQPPNLAELAKTLSLPPPPFAATAEAGGEAGAEAEAGGEATEETKIETAMTAETTRTVETVGEGY